MRIRFFTNQLGSKSLKEVAKELTKRLGYKVWLSSHQKPLTLNVKYGAVVDKISQYKWFEANHIPSLEYTTSKEQAETWAKKNTIFARKFTTASKGKGIVIVEKGGVVPMAPVYTKYRKKKKEFRVHVFKDKIVSIVEKRKRSDYEGNGDPRIRNTVNGYVFCHNDVVEPEGICELALNASKVTPSDFKGVDIGYNVKKNELFVIEVNSAPGIEGSNINLYADTIVSTLKLKK